MKEGLPFPDNLMAFFGYKRAHKNEEKKPDWLIEEEKDRKRTYMMDDVMCRRDREADEAEEFE